MAAATCTTEPTNPICSVVSASTARTRNAAAISRWPRSAIPDGNGWMLQEISTRLPGRVEADTIFISAAELAATLHRAAVAHGEHEKRTGGHDENWADWYAEYIVREQGGEPLPS